MVAETKNLKMYCRLLFLKEACTEIIDYQKTLYRETRFLLPRREGMNAQIAGPYVAGFKCMLCGQEYPADFSEYVCPQHGNEGVLDVLYTYDAASTAFCPKRLAASQEKGMWRYRSMLPLPLDAAVPPLCVGGTPLYDAPRLAKAVGVSRVLIKDDGQSPTASFKDRASALAVSIARYKNADVIATASTGNAAAALAGMAAAMGQACAIFVPKSAPAAKIAQLLTYGATVFAVQGTYDQAFDLCTESCIHTGWYNRNTGYNPLMGEGKKTAAYEIAEQMDWKIPDAVFVSTGDGCIISGLHKGFQDLLALGLIDRLPRLYGVQASGSDFMTQAFENHEDVQDKAPIAARTVADSLATGLPRDRVKAMRAVQDTGGAYLRVDDEAILAAIPDLAQGCGVFAEPAAAAAWAGVAPALARGLVDKNETLCVVCTGSGLKDVQAAIQACSLRGQSIIPIAASAEGLAQVLRYSEKNIFQTKE